MRRASLTALFLSFSLLAQAQKPPAPENVKAPAPRLAPGDNLVLQGIPDVPMEMVERVGPYTEYRSAIFSDWHPTRREIAVLTRFGDTQQLHLVNHPGGARKQLTFFRDRVGAARFQRGASGDIVFSKDSGGGEFFQLYRLDTKTGEVTLLTDGKSRNTGPLYSPRGDLLVYNSTRRNGQDTDFYLIDPRDPKNTKTNRLLAQVNGGGWEALDWSPDARTLLVREGISVNESYLWLIDVESGRMTPLIGRAGPDPQKDPFALRAEKETVAYAEGRFAPDGKKGIYAVTDRDAEFMRLVYLDLETRRHEPITAAIKWDIDTFDVSPDGRTLCVVVNEDGVGTLRLYDAGSRAELPRPQLPPGSVRGCQFHERLPELAFNLVSARSPFDVYSLDLSGARAATPGGYKVERWTESETAISTAALPEPAPLRWRSFDGKMISGYFYRPPARFRGPRPVVINIHGGPESQSRPAFLGQTNYLLQELGVAVVYPNVRGSTGYGKGFTKLDNGERREDSVKDIGALLDHLASRPEFDKGRIMVMGGSYGGYMSLAVAAAYSDRIRCAVDVVGISNFITFLERTEAYRRDLRRVEYGDERDPRMRAILQRISPLTNAGRIKRPLLVVQGKNDPRVPAFEAEQIVATLQKNGTPVWYLLANDEGHGFAKKRNADFLFYVVALFIKQHLLS
jgi:dipeptidyl aminopeptidase/acylaminoacyl peptidase